VKQAPAGSVVAADSRGRAAERRRSTLAVERIERLAALLVALATVGSLLLGDRRVVFGVGLGGALAVLNFAALRRIMQGMFASDNPRRQIVMTLLLMGKLALLAVVMYAIIRYVPVNAAALLGGISAVVLAIFVEGFRSVLCQKRTVASSE
jgi:hypothetical protein